MYITANISGGHLNPAVTLATIFTGHISIVKGIAYIFMQITGACFGVLMVVSLKAELWPHQTSAFARFKAAAAVAAAAACISCKCHIMLWQTLTDGHVAVPKGCEIASTSVPVALHRA